MKKMIVENIYYNSQLEFADHIKQMLVQGYILSNINFKKNDKEHFMASYIKKIEEE